MSSQIAAKVAAPLAKTTEIVMLSGDGGRGTGELNRLLAELPVSVNALTGVDITKVIIWEPTRDGMIIVNIIIIVHRDQITLNNCTVDIVIYREIVLHQEELACVELQILFHLL